MAQNLSKIVKENQKATKSATKAIDYINIFYKYIYTLHHKKNNKKQDAHQAPWYVKAAWD